jgi:hypothetical protein
MRRAGSMLACLIKSRCGSLKDCWAGEPSNANNETDEPANRAVWNSIRNLLKCLDPPVPPDMPRVP